MACVVVGSLLGACKSAGSNARPSGPVLPDETAEFRKYVENLVSENPSTAVVMHRLNEAGFQRESPDVREAPNVVRYVRTEYVGKGVSRHWSVVLRDDAGAVHVADARCWFSGP